MDCKECGATLCVECKGTGLAGQDSLCSACEGSGGHDAESHRDEE